MNEEHHDLRQIHDELVEIHHRQKELLATQKELLAVTNVLLLTENRQVDLLASIDRHVASLDVKTPELADIEADAAAITETQKGTTP